VTLTVEIPDAITREMHLDGVEARRRALIGIVVEGYRRHELSRGQVSEMLGLSFWETADLLKEQGCGIGSGLTVEEFQRQSEQLQAYIDK
jgi:predicted HTH domain antitoxin